ncbi:beta-L-arabinofuranosidase domain-containing protein [Confluentibacter citreus]|uniref:beta-L-arabinofuranosidase domain-containing protein n=1 Tax=Confluentibacter citreus TaxID=2007307 RepID=UPI000C28CA4C|nr:beta-L-arabinofuranosidase domain-containing protein [Confluentibacter citreus]
MFIKIASILFVFTQLSSFAQNPLANHDIEKAKPFSSTSVILSPSWIKHREDLNTNYLESLDAERLLHNFRVNAGFPSNAKPLDGWESPSLGLRGHFVGHYISAVSTLVERNKEPLLTQHLNYMIEELYKCQQALGNGYLSAFPEKDFDTLEATFGGVWAPYYTYNKIMQGLLDAYTKTNNQKAYKMVVDMASYVEKRMSKLDDATIEKLLYTAAANPSNEAGAMNEVLYKLYRVSKNPNHLKLAKIFDRDWFVTPLANNDDILSGLHSNTHLVLVNGFAERYAVTGEALYKNAVYNFWDMLINHHAYANGSSSGPRPNVTTKTSLTAEHWGVPDQLSNTMTKEIAESCVSHNTQKLTATLFSWTANPMYAETYMNTFHNSVMALQSANTGAVVYHLPLGSPRKKIFLKDNDFRCCNGSSIEAFSQLNSGIYYHDDSNLWVNLYVPSKVNWDEKNISIEQTGNFPTSSEVSFSVSAKKKTAFNLNLFVPSWGKKVEVYVNNIKQEIEITPNSYVHINREWKNSDTVKLVFHYDFCIKTMPDDKNVIAIFYGPILMAFQNDSEIILKGKHETILSQLSKNDNVFSLDNADSTYILKPLYNIDEDMYSVYATIRNY